MSACIMRRLLILPVTLLGQTVPLGEAPGAGGPASESAA
jgi:hypothetical protein